MTGRPASSYAGGRVPKPSSSPTPSANPNTGDFGPSDGQQSSGGIAGTTVDAIRVGQEFYDAQELAKIAIEGLGGPNGGYYNPSIPNYDAYSRMPIIRGTQATGIGYADPDRFIGLPQGSLATTMGGLQASFWKDPATQSLVMRAVSNYYGYEVKNLSYGNGFIKDAAQIASASGDSAWDIILGFASGAYGSSPGGSPSGGYGGGGGGGGSTSRIQLTNPDQAKALVDQAMATALGRGSTEKERAEFLKALNDAERANPYTQSIEGGAVVTAGGVDPTVRAEEFAEAQQGAAEFEAAGNLMAAFISAIEDPVNL